MKHCKAAIVTGGAHRIGKAISMSLADEGYSIVLHYGSSSDEARQTKVEIEAKGVQCQLISLDLKQSNSGPALFDKVDPHMEVKILVNSASIFEPSGFESTSEELLDLHYQINLRSPYSLLKTFINHYESGHIINILDTKIVHNHTRHLDYLLSKKSLHDLTLIAARECGPHFRVNGIAPGLILPPEGEDQSYLDRKAQRLPLRQTGKTQDIQQAIHYLINNPFITGQILYIDGGEHLQ